MKIRVFKCSGADNTNGSKNMATVSEQNKLTDVRKI